MVLDDDADLLFLLKKQLISMGFEATTHNNDDAIMERILLFKPALILLDINMGGIDGHELCKKIKKSPGASKVKVLIMTGNHDIEKSTSDCGADGYIEKPLTYSKVEQKVLAVLSET